MSNDDSQSAEITEQPGFLSALFQCKCSRCRKGNMFKNPIHFLSPRKNMQMPEFCPVCKQPLEIEVGFYYGTGYVSYALTIAVSVATFIAYWVVMGISIHDNSLFYWLMVNFIVLVILMPYIMRLSRAVWLSIFVKYDAHWNKKPPKNAERMVEEMRNLW